ncbi:AAA family ATPase [Pseudomonas sp. WAC2]|uniref:AAA family ATPase n=1 Tax=Pseudomonas sp. WAC2 TaxID=3055057 RepID=UPI0025B19CAE|nr:AAA family ATPase [Pseudomonas sp. WAC2]MDN3236140.1 AAA family ATPase [Pseudomonas sp. WAC2]
MNILITGASGSGTTTLGAALANRLHGVALDADSYYWLPTETPYTQRRDKSERNALLIKDMQVSETVIISGSIMNYGDSLENLFDLIVFLYLPAEIRIPRLKAREEARFGSASPEFWTGLLNTIVVPRLGAGALLTIPSGCASVPARCLGWKVI